MHQNEKNRHMGLTYRICYILGENAALRFQNILQGANQRLES